MSPVTRDDQTVGFARQAGADFASHVLLRSSDIPASQHLHFLQMACEKLCKAHYYADRGSVPKDIETSHAHIASRLPTIIRDVLQHDTTVSGKARSVILQGIRGFSREIELLAPSVDANKTRLDNCEYPWTDKAGNLQVPAEYDFPRLQFLQKEFGRAFLRLVKQAISELANA